MSYNADITYAYSRHLIWALVETTTAILVFCVPAMPIAFRGGAISRLYTWLGSKTKRLKGKTFLAETNDQHPWPQAPRTKSPNREYRVTDDPSELGLTELQLARSISRRDVEEQQGVAGLIQMGILRTTEIEITTRAESNSGASSLHNGTTMYPWSESP